MQLVVALFEVFQDHGHGVRVLNPISKFQISGEEILTPALSATLRAAASDRLAG
ncbi:MAG TPA: hypothetical protein VHM88_00760 [Candidatus Acidoferrales bacterium]|nr:hypothetical protein [Candidatus Acidoferrales bacterium]